MPAIHAMLRLSRLVEVEFQDFMTSKLLNTPVVRQKYQDLLDASNGLQEIQDHLQGFPFQLFTLMLKPIILPLHLLLALTFLQVSQLYQKKVALENILPLLNENLNFYNSNSLVQSGLQHLFQARSGEVRNLL